MVKHWPPMALAKDIHLALTDWMHSGIAACHSGLDSKVQIAEPVAASREELELFHTTQYIEKLNQAICLRALATLTVATHPLSQVSMSLLPLLPAACLMLRSASLAVEPIELSFPSPGCTTPGEIPLQAFALSMTSEY